MDISSIALFLFLFIRKSEPGDFFAHIFFCSVRGRIQTDKYSSKYRNISYGLLTSREFENIYVTKNKITDKVGIRTHDPRITITAEQY